MRTNPTEVVRSFWRLMETNDFHAIKRVLSADLLVEWPLSNEQIRGPENYARINAEYPTKGVWRFTLHRVLTEGPEVVTHVSFTDGEQSAEVISFFTVKSEAIVRIIEYFPEKYTPPSNRAHLTEPLSK